MNRRRQRAHRLHIVLHGSLLLSGALEARLKQHFVGRRLIHGANLCLKDHHNKNDLLFAISAE